MPQRAARVAANANVGNTISTCFNQSNTIKQYVVLLLLDIFDFILFVFKVTGNCSASAFRPEQKYVAASDDPFKWDARCHLEHPWPVSRKNTLVHLCINEPRP